jgi:peptide/nickel transport system permease protein
LIVRRLLVAVPAALFATSVFVFLLPEVVGNDVAVSVLRARFTEPEADTATASALREELGLDRPLLIRYVRFVADVCRGDFGDSYVTGAPFAGRLWEASRVSLSLLASSMALAITLGGVLGCASALYRRTRSGRFISALMVFVASVPTHVTGPLAALLLGVTWKILPTGGWGSAEQKVLPTVVLAGYPLSVIAMVLRAEMIEAFEQPFLLVARAKGIGPIRLVRHAFAVSRQGMIATSSVMCAGLLGGAVVVENVFSVPGLGQVLLLAARTSDLPVLQGALLIAVTFAVAIGALGDLLSHAVDPRITRPEATR